MLLKIMIVLGTAFAIMALSQASNAHDGTSEVKWFETTR